MTRIAFFEPEWQAHNARDWAIRGGYKYPSLISDLHERAEILLLMRTLPPADDPHRISLERRHDVTFAAIESCEDPEWPAADLLRDDYAAAIAEHAPDIVSTLNGRMIGINFAVARAARDAGTDYVWRIAGNDIVTRAAVFAARGRPFEGSAVHATMIAEERYAAEIARTMIVMGGTERARIAALTADPGKIRLCRRGVDRAHFRPPATAPEHCRRILFVGRDSPEKGIDLIEAAAALLPDLEFTIAGDFAPREEGNRRYLGFHDYAALPELYRAHDLLLLPARSEGFPQVVMEAMSCGLPAVLSRHLFVEDFAEQGKGASLVGLDATEIAEAIGAIAGDPVLYAAMHEAALGHAADAFDEAVNRPLFHAALLGERA